MLDKQTIDWLLDSDVSIQFQVYRDLLGVEKLELQNRIAKEGWGKKFLEARKPEGHWGKRFYEPKWISSHYTLLDLRHLNISPNNKIIKESINQILKMKRSPDGGVNPIGVLKKSDICINGKLLNYATYFKSNEEKLKSIVDFILSETMEDGGFNCMSNRSGAVHSSLHSTISVLEGFYEYLKNDYKYRRSEIDNAIQKSIEFVLQHYLFKSDKTGEIINNEFLKLKFPNRWKYDVLRALDFFQYARVNYDSRMEPAIQHLISKKGREGRWKLNAHHPGKVHFQMEKAGSNSRWITLKALRVLQYYKI